MQSSPLQLEDYMLKDLRFAIVPPLTNLEPPVAFDLLRVEVDAETQKRENDPLRWRCQLSIRSRDEDEGNFPFTFRLVYIGFFRVVKDYPAERIEQMVRTNAPALLYSAAREAIMFLTGRGRLPALLLPSVTFLEPPKAQPAKARTPSAAKRPTRPPAPR